MNQHRNKKSLDVNFKQQLDQELRTIEMSEAAKNEVIRRIKQRPSFWNREITIHVPAVLLSAAVFTGICFAMVFQQPLDIPHDSQMSSKLIHLESGVYDEKHIQRVLKE